MLAKDFAALRFLTMITRPNFRSELKPGEGGKPSVSMTRAVNAHGEEGP
jgi:hypothetical protein